MKINIAQAYAITKNHPEAWVLLHMSYWQPKATVQFGKHKWVVRTASEFVSDHGFPFNAETIRLAIRRLETKGLLEIRRAPHPIRAGVLRATWLRLSPKVEHELVPIEDINKSPADMGNHITEENSEESIATCKTSCMKTVSTIEEDYSIEGKNVKNEKYEKLRPKILYAFIRECQIKSKDVYIPLPEHMSYSDFRLTQKALSFYRNAALNDDQIRDVIAFAVERWTAVQLVGNASGDKVYSERARLKDLSAHGWSVLKAYEGKFSKQASNPEDYGVVSGEDVVFD